MTISISRNEQPAIRGAWTKGEEPWRSAERHLFALDVRPIGELTRTPAVRVRNLGDLVVTDWQTPTFEGLRSSRLADDGEPALMLISVMHGTQIMEAQTATVVAGPGSLLLSTSNDAVRVLAPDGLTKRVVRIPLRAISSIQSSADLPEMLLLNPDSDSLAGVVRDYVAGFDSRLDRMTSTEIDATRSALLNLVSGLVRSAQQNSEVSNDGLRSLRQRLEKWIIENLESGAIKVGELAAAHNVAVRTVHRAFAASGDTVGAVTRRHRLAGARNDLVTTSLPITTIAHRWGFCDPSHLGRQFRDAYSVSPGDYREMFAQSSLHEETLKWGA